MNFAVDLGAPEGPVLMSDGSLLVVEMAPERGCVTRISADGERRRVLARTGRPNGLAVDFNGDIWIAESQDPALLRMSPSGAVEVYATECGGVPFLFPNDLAFTPDGALYLTDSGILFEDFAPGGTVRADWRDLTVDGRLYRVDIRSGAVDQVDGDLQFPNGIAVGTDRQLYVNETLTGMVYRYALADDRVGPREGFGNVVAPSDDPAVRGPDGMKFAADGRLFVAVVGQGDVTVLDTDGEVARRIETAGTFPTNLAFGPPGSHLLYVTEDQRGAVEVFNVGVDGAALYNGLRA